MQPRRDAGGSADQSGGDAIGRHSPSSTAGTGNAAGAVQPHAQRARGPRSGRSQLLRRPTAQGHGGQLPAPAGNPAFGTLAWTLRDVENEYCATGRLQDELTNPAFSADAGAPRRPACTRPRRWPNSAVPVTSMAG